MKEPPQLDICVGLPGSGKSRFVSEQARRGFLTVDIDSIVTMLHGRNYRKYQDKFIPVYKTIETQIVMACLLAGHDLVFDKCCNLQSTRERIAELGHQLGAEVCYVVFPSPGIDVLVQRRMTNPRDYDEAYWREVIEVRANNADAIQPYEPYDSILIMSDDNPNWTISEKRLTKPLIWI